MTQFTLTDERKEFKKLAREFSDGELRPNTYRFDSTGEFPREILKKAWEIGLVNFQVPEEHGGLALSNLDSCVILEELACGCSGISAPIEATTLAQAALIKFGTDKQKQTYLKPVIDSPAMAGYASHRKNVNDIAVTKAGSDYVLDGTHASVSNGGTAEWYLVNANVGGKYLTFVVPGDANGLILESRNHSIGRKASASYSMRFAGVKLTEKNLLMSPDDTDVAALMEPTIAVLVAAGAVGVAQSAMMHAIDYSKQRQTFGKAIGQHQAVAFILADMAREIEAARLLVWQAAFLIDSGNRAFEKALAAKISAQEVVMKVTTDAVQVYGGYGYSKEYPVEKLMRDAKQYQLFEGSPAQDKAALARHLLLTTAQGNSAVRR